MTRGSLVLVPWLVLVPCAGTAFGQPPFPQEPVLQLEAGGVNPELLHTVFRAAHSIKGGSASFGFVAIAGFTHVVESVLDRMRDGALDPSPARKRART